MRELRWLRGLYQAPRHRHNATVGDSSLNPDLGSFDLQYSISALLTVAIADTATSIDGAGEGLLATGG